jgi:predicted nucleic acid-binding protein
MKQVFIDSSVLVSACRSRTGASAAILALCKRGKIAGYISRTVRRETKKNIAALGQDVKNRLNVYLLQHKLIMVSEPPAADVVALTEHIREKDAPVLAAALRSPATHLVTLDFNDFMRPEVRAVAPQLIIVSPGDFVRDFIRSID